MILDLCAGTGAWGKPYRENGYDVRNITLPNQDVRLFQVPREKVQGVLAAPPCTHLSSSGARWWKDKGENALLEALALVDACLRIIVACSPSWWALENPVGRLRHYLGPPKLIFNPCDYGDPWTKKTCLWGNFEMPEKNPIKPSLGSRLHRLPPSTDRGELRAVTPPRFAQAFFEANR